MPSTDRILSKPPIREAIFTIIFKDAIPADRLQMFRETEFVKSKFPSLDHGFKLEGQVSKEGIITRQTADGFTLKPGDNGTKNRLVQVKPTYLSYHNLSSYDGWDTMISELKDLWSEFCKSVGKGQLAEVKVRNINHITLPLPFESGFKDYLSLLPTIPVGVNPALSNFFLQIQTSEKNLQAIITEAVLDINSSEMKLNFLLDITVYKREQFECNEGEMWNAFDELREYKDNIFFACITDKTKNLFV